MEISWRKIGCFLTGCFILGIGFFAIKHESLSKPNIVENEVVMSESEKVVEPKTITKEVIATEENKDQTKNENTEANSNIQATTVANVVANTSEEKINAEIERQAAAQIVYDGLTKQELIDKLNRSLNSTLAGQGELYATYSLSLGLDPYLALAITLQETGCKWECSSLVKQCNNVGGMKGQPGCNGGSYKAFATLEEGIKGYLDNLYNNYYSKGLTTPELMNSKYAASTTWASKVNNYIALIKAN